MKEFKLKLCKVKITLITLLGSLLLSFFVLYTPKLVGKDNKTTFSAVRAAEHIEAITKKPHSYYDQVELEEVRVYLRETLKKYLGEENLYDDFVYDKNELKPVINEDLDYDLINIMGKIPGKNEKGILLVAHYDSRGHVGRYGESGRSYGAMDDGYGVGSLLELAYILKDINPENTIYFLFTDAEEVGLYGAKMAAKDKKVMDNVSFVINLESRGSYGPSYMFETSKNNSRVIDLYKHAKYPVTYSMATAVYSVMPNFTDFTPFINENVPGMNFANLAGLDHYHSPTDSYENISLTTIQHMGSQVEPIIREFAGNSKYTIENYFDAKNDQVFFTLFTGVLISYKQIVAVILVILLLIGFSVLTYFKIKNREISKDVLTKTLAKGLLLTLVLVLSGLIFSYIIAFLGKVPFNITYVRVSEVEFISLLFILGVFSTLFVKINNSNLDDVLYLGVSINLLLALLTTFMLPGASFLFLLHAFLGLVVILSNYLTKKYLKHFIYVISILVLVLIIAPLIWSFYMALTVGGMAILVLLLTFSLIVIIPTILKQRQLETN